MERKAAKLLFYALSHLSKKINLSFRMQARPQKGLGTDFHLGQRQSFLQLALAKDYSTSLGSFHFVVMLRGPWLGMSEGTPHQEGSSHASTGGQGSRWVS